jgi:hypothetical protein
MAAPEALAQEYDRRCAAEPVCGAERSTEDWRIWKHANRVGRHHRAVDRNGFVRAELQVDFDSPKSAQVFERRCVIGKKTEAIVLDAGALRIRFLVRLDENESLAVRERQLAEQHRVQERESGCRHADADS